MKPLAPLPAYSTANTSALVRAFDEIRFGPMGDAEQHEELCWFIREYPRIYRHHLDHAQYRLALINEAYKHHHTQASQKLASLDDPANFIGSSEVSRAVVPHSTFVMYWNLESFLQAVSTALDIVTRIVGTAFREQTSPNFNQFCKKAPDCDLKAIFVSAQCRWVTRVKAYRDCFTHFTPVDTLPSVELTEYADAWEVRAKLPVNPAAREILRFRYSRRADVLRFAIRTHKRLVAFDRSVAKEIRRLYRNGEYPKKSTDLFRLGRKTEQGRCE